MGASQGLNTTRDWMKSLQATARRIVALTVIATATTFQSAQRSPLNHEETKTSVQSPNGSRSTPPSLRRCKPFSNTSIQKKPPPPTKQTNNSNKSFAGPARTLSRKSSPKTCSTTRTNSRLCYKPRDASPKTTSESHDT